MKILGIDLGSRYVKLVIMQDNRIIYKGKWDTVKFYRDFCENNGKLFINLEKMGIEEVDKIVATGYGRNNMNINKAVIIPELKAHVFGAIFQTGTDTFVLLDMGGQDTKIVEVVKGKIMDILLNDKCAASCGRYLENMANILNMSIDELSEYYKEPVILDSTCAVFGESELIGKISEGYPIERLAAGVNYSLFKRVKTLIQKYRLKTLIFSGGVALNKAVLHFIKEETFFENIIVPEDTVFNGALGCCYYVIKEGSLNE